MECKAAGDMQVAMLLDPFGDKKKLKFRYVLASLQSRQKNLDWETAR